MIKLPNYPKGRIAGFPFWRPLSRSGKLMGWLRAGSPIDRQPGVYFLFDVEGDRLYIGSSAASNRQANVRRTLIRHFQTWERRKAYYSGAGGATAGGVVVPRRDALVCVIPIPSSYVPPTAPRTSRASQLSPARVVEDWYLGQICDQIECLNTVGVGAVYRDDPDIPF